MDTLSKTDLIQAIVKILQDYFEFLGNDSESELQLIIDENKDHYLLMEIGWHKNQRIYGSFIHIDIINKKIWALLDFPWLTTISSVVATSMPKLSYKSGHHHGNYGRAKIWIQQDGTEEGVANELVKQGISPQQIVIAF